jgi:tetratricopeptide (TPR) repeat protein
MNIKNIVSIVFVLFLSVVVSDLYSQEYKTNTRKGNKAYEKKKYNDAEILYRKALEADSTFYKAQYNMGDALYKENQYSEAAKYYNKAIENPNIDKGTQSKAYYNMGNSFLQAGLSDKENPQAMEYFKNAIASYQNSLRINPKDEDAKYNLSYAKKMLQQQQQQQQNQNQQNQQQNQDNKDNKDNQDKKEQEQKQNNQNNQQQNKDQNQDKQNNKPQGGDRKEEQKKQDAERVLEAVKNNEKKTLDKQKVKVRGGKIEKDW